MGSQHGKQPTANTPHRPPQPEAQRITLSPHQLGTTTYAISQTNQRHQLVHHASRSEDPRSTFLHLHIALAKPHTQLHTAPVLDGSSKAVQAQLQKQVYNN